MLPQDSGYVLIKEITESFVIIQTKEVTMQIILFYYQDAVGKIESLEEIPLKILKHLGNFLFCGVLLYALRLQRKAFFLPEITDGSGCFVSICVPGRVT